jgi:hypothetical protein
MLSPAASHTSTRKTKYVFIFEDDEDVIALPIGPLKRGFPLSPSHKPTADGLVEPRGQVCIDEARD